MLTEQPAITEPAEPCSVPPLDPAPLLIALVAQTAEGALADALKRERPVVTFSSLDELCAALDAGSKWAGVVISSWCVWDSRVGEHVPNLSTVSLFGYAEGFGWPDEVRRLSDEGELKAWLKQLNATEASPAVMPAQSAPEPQNESACKEQVASAVEHEDASAVDLQSAREADEERPLPAQSAIEPQNERACEEQVASAVEHEDASAVDLQSAPEGGSKRPEGDGALKEEDGARSEPAADDKPVQAPGASASVLATKPSKRRRSASTPAGAAHQVNADVGGQSSGAKPTARRAPKAGRPALRASARNTQQEQQRSDAQLDPRGDAAQQELMKLALQIGLQRAREIIGQLRGQAHQLLGDISP